MRNVLGLLFALIGWVFVLIGLRVMSEKMRNEYSVKGNQETRLLGFSRNYERGTSKPTMIYPD